MSRRRAIVNLGVFVADTTYRADRMPRIGETILGKSFALGPGGKGSNQSVASARAGGEAHFITRLGDDAFADMALAIWRDSGVTPHVVRDSASYTGAAFIFVEAATGNNAIIISPGAAGEISAEDVERNGDMIGSAAIFITQLEQPIPAARRGLEIARAGGARTILNPAPAAPLDRDMLALCDFVTPNETETTELTGIAVNSLDDARRAADALIGLGVGAVVITLGEKGCLVHGPGYSEHVPSFNAGPVVETTGAGDAFNGAFAVALAEGRDPVAAARFGCATASLSVTRPGTAASMPTRTEIDALLARG